MPLLSARRNHEMEDDTFKEAGKVGVWTKADSTTLFDAFGDGPESRLSDMSATELEEAGKGDKAGGDGGDWR